MENLPAEQKITETLEKNYMPYAMSVIISRAIPEIDGFKPSHRKLLYTMYKMGLLKNDRRKSSTVVGETMKLNPHGDAAIYETMVRLTRGNAALLHPFVDSKGNFGKEYSRDMAYAAARYTEVKLDPICHELFGEIDSNTVDMVDNYDNSMKEPSLLPVTFPTVLCNSNTGIAVGMASNICSFNLRELCDATIAILKNRSADVREYMTAPDFPGGGQIIYNKADFDAIFETGRGSFKIRAKYSYDKKANCIDIYEIPYTTTSEAIVDKIIELIKQNKLREVTDVRDETGLSGLKITIDLRRGVDPDKLMTRLYKQTPLEDSFGCNFNVLIDGQPRVLGVRALLDEWIAFRSNCIRRRLEYEIMKKSERLHLLYGLRELLLDIDKAVRIIRETEQESEVVPNLMMGFSIDEIQADYIAEIKLRNLNKEYILRKTDEIKTLEDEVAERKDILANEKAVKKLIISDLEAVKKKYGQDRKSEIISDDEIDTFDEAQLIEDYNLRAFLTRDGYFKKISLVSLRSASDQKVKDGDEIITEIECSNKADILFFSSKACVYKAKLYELNDCKASSFGEYLPNVLGLEEGEQIVDMLVTDDYKGMVVFAFENGKVAKVPLNSYETKTNRKRLINAYSDFSPLCNLLFLPEDTLLCVFSSNNKALTFASEEVSLKTTKNTRGVQVLTCRKNMKMTRICRAEDSGLISPDKYKTKNIPAAGFFLKDEDRPEKQMTLFDE